MAAVDYFLKIDGIDGGSTDAKHKGEIDVTSFSWGAAQAAARAGGGAAAGRPQLQPLHLTKTIDKASPNLFLKCATGQHIKRAVLVARKAGEVPVEFLKIAISDVLVSAFAQAAVEQLPSDDLALSFASLQFTQGPQQHIAVTPTAAGMLAFDPKTKTVSIVEGPAGVMTAGSVNGLIQRAVQEFDVAILIGLLTAPFSTAKLRLAVNEVREAAIDAGVATIASVDADEREAATRSHVFDVVLYTPADGVVDAGDLARRGTRVGRIAVDPSAPPASLEIDLTSIVAQRELDAFGIRIQLHGLELPDPFDDEEDDDVPATRADSESRGRKGDGEHHGPGHGEGRHGDGDGQHGDGQHGDGQHGDGRHGDGDHHEDEDGRAPFAASFSLDLALDTA